MSIVFLEIVHLLFSTDCHVSSHFKKQLCGFWSQEATHVFLTPTIRLYCFCLQDDTSCLNTSLSCHAYAEKATYAVLTPRRDISDF
jgi:hypothetical protein